MSGSRELPTIAFATPADFEAWLEAEGAEAGGVWMKTAKKGSGVTTVTYAQALDVALCHGWIDGQVRSLDETYYLQRFTPRRARSKWSKRNRDHVARLVEEGRMRAGGLREVERAKEDGRWDAAYDSPSNIQVPDDLQAALDANPAAAEAFAGLSSQNRYAVLYRTHDARRPETRARRIAQFVEMLARGETPHP
jgi:uncharacterized protein YdeI (YjbR/CyaY-like superfamily)